MGYFIDTHFHLDHYRNYTDLIEEINKLQQYTVCVTNSPGVFLSCKNMLPESKYLKFAIGFHPQEKNLSHTDLKDFLRLIDRTNYVGEVGLDFSSDAYRDRNAQIDAFEQITQKCARDNKMMIVHIRRSEELAIDIIRRYAPKKCIIHWYTGSEKHLQQLLDAGCFFSINANMISSNSSDKYRAIPNDRRLVESDGPYTKVGGEKYAPSLLPAVYLEIARFYNDPDFILHTYQNFQRLLTL